MDGWTFPFVSFIIISRMLKNRGKGSMNETILLIEDNESIIMGLEYLLTEEQYTFLAAETDLICAGKLRNMTLHRSFF